MAPAVGTVTDPRAGADDEQATRALTAALYGDLRRIARSVRPRGAGQKDATLQTTALIHEAYLKLHRSGCWQSREHFMNAAAVAMRQALVDHARARLSAKRGGGQATVELDEIADVLSMPEEQLLELDEALQRLARVDARLAKVVECRYFAGYSVEETGAVLGMAERTVYRDWELARSWLFREMSA
jgi:RNA polymerase sigma factor (TIGR02999 family)